MGMVRSRVVSGEVWGGMGNVKLLGAILGVMSWVSNGEGRARVHIPGLSLRLSVIDGDTGSLART